MLDLLVVNLQQFLVDLPEITLPFLSANCVEHCWEVIGTTVHNLILFAQIVNIAISHFAILLQKLWIELQSLQLEDERP